MPTLHSRVSKDTYQHLLDIMKAKLTGWKATSLSMAGRFTLAKCVLDAIPFYTMQTSKIPVSLLDVIDRLVRNFVWGHDSNTRQLHLISWETFIKPIDEGGLGLRSMHQLNQAALAKTAWRFLSNIDCLWVRVLRAKYIKEANGVHKIVHVTNSSNLWKWMVDSWSKLEEGLIWKVENGYRSDSGLILGS